MATSIYEPHNLTPGDKLIIEWTEGTEYGYWTGIYTEDDDGLVESAVVLTLSGTHSVEADQITKVGLSNIFAETPA